jgi:hypothetical protein
MIPGITLPVYGRSFFRLKAEATKLEQFRNSDHHLVMRGDSEFAEAGGIT